MSADTTIIIPTWNSLAYLPRCLEALAAHSPGASVIVVDNASTDGTVAWLAEHASHVTVLTNPTNEGFGAACNRGVAAATTTWVCLLNADAFVTAGWLDALHAALAAVPRAAVAAPMFLNEDGSLQEAGGMLPRSGTGVLYGNGDSPTEWRFRFPRIVDYSSAACWLVERSFFLDLGGFDVEAYGLAYYEDADFCLRAAATGACTVYTPDAQVVHVRNASATSDFIADLLVRNQETFVARWHAVLDRRPPLTDLQDNPHRVITTRDAEQWERLLVIVRDLPDAGSALTAELTEAMRAWPHARVSVISDAPPSDTEAAALMACGIEVGAGHDDWYGWLRDRIAFYTTVLVVGAAMLERYGALVEWTQSNDTRLHIAGSPPADPWRPYHRSRFTYRAGAEFDPAAWHRIDPDTDLVATLTSVGWSAPATAPGPT